MKNVIKKFPFWPMFKSDEVKHTEQIARTFKAKADARRTITEKFADWMTSRFGSVTFLIINSIWFLIWILINANFIPGVEAFDPFPFSLLTTIVSLEAIILAVFVLISQNRAARVEDIREEVELQISIIAEKEVTKIMKMLSQLLEKHGVDVSADAELKKMLKTVSAEELERKLEKEF